MKLKIRALLAAPLSLALFASVAHAHPGHGTGVVAGLVHPLTGWDHLLAMVAVGLWAAQMGGRARWALPGTFVGSMTVGAMVGLAGVAPPGMESMILVSVLLLGTLVAGAVRLPLRAGLPLVGLLAFFHGAAHGAEMPADAASEYFLAGMVASTAALHAAGVGLGVLAQRLKAPSVVRWAGAAIVAGGLLLCCV